MHSSRARLLLAGALAGFLAFFGCEAKKKANTGPRPRPVRVAALEVTDPSKALRLTGSVASWKEQDIGFEVAGRVAFIVDDTTNLEGRWEEDGKVRVKGDVLARLDPRDYEIARDQAKANLVVAQKRLATAKVELEHVLPAQVRATEAELERAQAEFEKNTQAYKTKAVSELDLIRARAARDSSQARNEEAKAQIETKQAEIDALKADEEKARQDLVNAEYDLARCELHAPFDAEVAEITVEAGGYARRGQAVAHLVMMDPIKVDLAVSEATMRQMRRGDSVQVFLPERPKESLNSIVYEKATVADPETRTFRISLLTRNPRDFSLPKDSPLRKLPTIDLFNFLQPTVPGDPSRGYVVEERRALRKDEKGHYVWASADLRQGDRLDPKRPVVKLSKYYVKPGDARKNLQGIFLGRSLVDLGKLEPGMMIAMDVPDGVKNGSEVLLARRRWSLRPGQLVEALLAANKAVPGLYVPPGAIRPGGNQQGSAFFLVDDVAREAKVRIVGSVGEAIRIEPADEAAAALVKPGSRMILDYIHFLEDQDPVHVIREEEMKS